MSKRITAAEAASMISDGSHVAILGSGGGVLEPEAVYKEIEKRFLSSGHPQNLSLTAACGFGDKGDGGISRFAHEGMTRRIVGGHWAWSPKMQKLALENKVEAYNFPQGALISQYRELAAKRAGLLTRIGLGTFVDPRLQGGRLNDISHEDLVEIVELNGQDWIHYKPTPIDVAIIRGTVADEDGNITITHEPANGEMLSMAQAAHNNGGKVICQVKYMAKANSLHPRDVHIPGFLVDAIVVVDDQKQSRAGSYLPELCGGTRLPLGHMPPMPLDARKIIARRAAKELYPGAVINLGVGIPDGVATVAAEEGIAHTLNITIEQGIIGGVPSRGDIFGTAINPVAMIDAAYQFDFYGGGGLDITCLGMAQADQYGNVNVSKFGSTIAGCGGFIDISQTAKTCIFCGTFTAGGFQSEVKDSELHILQEGRIPKFLNQVEQITFSGDYARKQGQRVLYVTERAVFELTPEGFALTEIAPGIDLERDILELMAFSPLIPSKPRLMDSSIFADAETPIFERVMQSIS